MLLNYSDYLKAKRAYRIAITKEIDEILNEDQLTMYLIDSRAFVRYRAEKRILELKNKTNLDINKGDLNGRCT